MDANELVEEESRTPQAEEAERYFGRSNRQVAVLLAVLTLVAGVFLIFFGSVVVVNSPTLVMVSGSLLIATSLAIGSGLALQSERPTYSPSDHLSIRLPPTIASRGKLQGLKVDPLVNEDPPTHGVRAHLYQQKSLERLDELVGALGRRANFSLIVGLIFAAGGVAILGSSLIINTQPPPEDVMRYVAHYLPRLSITVIVELVAFFFLRTYARTLTDIRYVQNEFTNVEMKFIGLHSSIDQGLAEVTKKALVALINTERNHILEKGQTSLDMERERTENEGIRDALASVAAIVHGKGAVETTKLELDKA